MSVGSVGIRATVLVSVDELYSLKKSTVYKFQALTESGGSTAEFSGLYIWTGVWKDSLVGCQHDKCDRHMNLHLLFGKIVNRAWNYGRC